MRNGEDDRQDDGEIKKPKKNDINGEKNDRMNGKAMGIMKMTMRIINIMRCHSKKLYIVFNTFFFQLMKVTIKQPMDPQPSYDILDFAK